MSKAIVQQASNAGALNAEHYQSFEMAKANDDILGGDNIAQIRSYAAYARAQAQAIHKSIATMGELEDVAQAKAEMTETSQTFAKVSVYADTRIGEILRELPKAKGNQYQQSAAVGTPTKAEAEKQAGIGHATSIDLQAMAANPEVVEAVIAKATEEGKVVSRSQVLKAINEKKQAERELQKASITQTNLEMEVESLRQQLEEQPEPKVIEREVVREVESEESKRRIAELEHLERIHHEDNQKLRKRNEDMRKELDRAHDILNLNQTTREIQRDVQYLITSTNQYVRHYGGLAWTVQSLSEVDGPTIEELRKAVRNLATFANTLMNCLEEING